MTDNTPMSTITASGGVRNCQTDSPAARATTSSILRDKFRNAIIDPNRTANGKACSATVGVRRNDSPAMKNSGCTLGIAGTAEQLHQIDGVDQNENHHKGCDDGAREAAREIEG